MDKSYDGSIVPNDENTNLTAGKKRQQLQSPFSAATPKSRIGKEPKRMLGVSPLINANKADPNLEETRIEAPTPCSDVTDYSFADTTAPNAEQSDIMDQTTNQSSSTCKDLSMVEEGEETDADVTLADSFEEKVNVEEKPGQKTPTPSTPKPTSASTPTAPATLVLQIQKTCGAYSHETAFSPILTPKPVVDQSISRHEFLMLEQETEYVVNAKCLQEKVEQLEQAIKDINVARVYEEKALMDQTEAVAKKAKVERVAAQQRIEQLQEKILELEQQYQHGQSGDEEKQQLEERLTQLSACVEDLTTKALKVEEMKQGMVAYEERLQVVMDEKLQLTLALTNSRVELEQLQKQSQDGAEKVLELEAKLAANNDQVAQASDSDARLAEAEKEREEYRQMMLQEMSELESQLEETREQLKKALEKNEASPPLPSADAIEELEEQASLSATTIQDLEKTISQHATELDSLRQQHQYELEEIRKKHDDEFKLLREQFDAAETRLAESVQNAEKYKEVEAQFASLQKQFEETAAESQTSAQEIQVKAQLIQDLQENITARTAEIEEKSQSISQLTAELDASHNRQEELNAEISALGQQLETACNNSQSSSEQLAQKHQEEIEKFNAIIATLEQQLVEKDELAAEKMRELDQSSQLEEMRKKNEEELNILREQYTAAESMLAESAQNVEKLKEMEVQLFSAQQQLESLTSESQKSVAEVQKNEMLIQDLQDAIASRLAESEEKEESIVKLNSELEVSRARVEELISELSDLGKQLKEDSSAELEEKHQEEMEKLVSNIAALEESVKLAEVHIADNDRKLEELAQEKEAVIESLRHELSLAQEQMQAQNENLSQITVLTAEKDAAFEKISNFEVQLEEAREQLKTAQESNDVQEYIVKIQKLEEEAFLSATKLTELEQTIAQNVTELDSTRQTHLEEIVEIRAKHDEELKLLQEQNAATEARLAEAVQHVEKLKDVEAQLVLSQKQLESVKSESQTSLDEMQVKEKQIQDLQESINARVAEIEEKTQSIAQLTAELTESRNRHEELNAEITALGQQLEIACNNSQSSSEQLAQKHQEEIEKFNATIATLEQQLVEKEELAAEKIRELEESLGQDLLLVRQQAESLLEKESQMQHLHATQLETINAEKEAALATIEELRAQVVVAENTVNDLRSNETDLTALNSRIAELETSSEALKQQLAEVEAAHQEKTTQLETSKVTIEKLEAEISSLNEISSMNSEVQKKFDESMATISDLKEKLEVAEQAMSNKENAIVSLESRIETISAQYEQRLAEAFSWKTQAQSVEVLTTTLASMQTQLSEMSAKLEASDRRVVEVQENADHDVTLMREEVNEQAVELDTARARISELERLLGNSKKEVERLEKLCDEFDDDEAQLKEKIRELQEEIKDLKGIKPPPQQMGLIQQARQGVNPLSRESSRVVEDPKEEDRFEDASDLFMGKPTQKTLDATALQTNSANSTTAHPDDTMAPLTPSSKKANRSNCQQQ
uniref:Uncharacterized protein n=1 Tax=Caenorhabditis japonica TaxID=281687 RepID=A0A8R1DIQ1_CAEJA